MQQFFSRIECHFLTMNVIQGPLDISSWPWSSRNLFAADCCQEMALAPLSHQLLPLDAVTLSIHLHFSSVCFPLFLSLCFWHILSFFLLHFGHNPLRKKKSCPDLLKWPAIIGRLMEPRPLIVYLTTVSIINSHTDPSIWKWFHLIIIPSVSISQWIWTKFRWKYQTY